MDRAPASFDSLPRPAPMVITRGNRIQTVVVAHDDDGRHLQTVRGRSLRCPLGWVRFVAEPAAAEIVGAIVASHLQDSCKALCYNRVSGPSAETENGTAALTIFPADVVGYRRLMAGDETGTHARVWFLCESFIDRVTAEQHGRMVKLIGDGVLAYFGWPQAYEGAAGRAVRAGLGLVAAVAGLKSPISRTLIARIQITTGLVVEGDLLGEGAAREETVIGEVPNATARLQQLAEPGTVVITEGTRRLLEGGYDLKNLGATALRGFAESVRAWQVAGESHARDRFKARQRAGL